MIDIYLYKFRSIDNVDKQDVKSIRPLARELQGDRKYIYYMKKLA